ncbi:cytochrome P450 [Panus rudis PR-1116 ss-1]|nr:cytochrome P450 [Panus rudis PR-1116 ss-1]
MLSLFDLSPSAAGLLLGVVCIIVLAYRVVSASSDIRLPPGPKRLPILGNVHQLPAKYQERKFELWGRQYGKIIFAKLFRTPALIISSFDVAHDLMEKRSRNYSGRPRFILLEELMGWKRALSQADYNDQFRLQRKWMQEALQTRESLESYRSLRLRETSIALAGLLASPSEFVAHFTRYSAATIIDITYGHQVTSDDDMLIGIAERAATATVTAGSPGSMLVDFFPILRHLPLWMPGSGFLSRAREVEKLVRELYDVPYNMVRKQMAAGTARPSLTAKFLEDCGEGENLSQFHEECIKGAVATLYGAGTETTATVMISFVLAMTLYPEVYKKLQEEIDQTIGPERLPDLDDKNSLPYLECVLKEVYRWHPPVPLGIPHAVHKDDEYNGYKLPAGSMLIGNIWAMSRDAAVYHDPEQFLPERFEKSDDAVLDPRNIVFGFGRRRCPGAEFADQNVFLLAACMAATMNISKAKDDQGVDITPAATFTSGFVSRPEPFQCVITPRSQKAIELITQMGVVNA